MPELPDVEFIRRRLESALVGGVITRARSSDRYVLRPHNAQALTVSLSGRSVEDVTRRGKWLRIALDDGGRLFSHLGMTGWWVEAGASTPKQRFERARIDLTKGGRAVSVRYLDSRRFGRLVIAKDDIAEWRDLGPDPLADGIDMKRFAATLARSRRPVKDVIMDQSLLAGIGNILATEALWHARIDPRARSSGLSPAAAGRLARALDKEIQKELRVRESSKTDEWRDVFKVYGHTKSACPRCGATIVSAVIGGRTSAFCRNCQKGRRSRRPGK